MAIIYGVGVNDADYKVQCHRPGQQWTCPCYMRWKSMMQRGYSKAFKEKNPAYVDVSVCAEWHSFMTFRSWMEGQDWDGNQLDKDMLKDGNNIYSDAACVFIPRYVNVLFTDARAARGAYPVGVCWNAKGSYFQMKCGNGDGTRTIVDCFETPEQAHSAWIIHKASVIRSTIEKYEKETCCDPRIVAILYQKIEKLNQAAKLGLEIIRL